MAAYTLADIRANTRAQMELESSDLSDTLIDLWATEATLQIVAERKRWPYFETEWSLAVVSGTQSYALSSLSPTSSVVRDVSAVRDPDNSVLMWAEKRELDRRFISSNSGQPTFWTLFGSSLYLYPTPSANDTFTITGYRKVNDWVADGAGASPDLPEELHPAVLHYCMFKGYAQQEDQGMATYWSQQFAAYVELTARDLVDSPPTAPIVMNGGPQNTGYPSFGRLRYDFE